MPVKKTKAAPFSMTGPTAAATRVGGASNETLVGDFAANRYLGGLGNDTIAAGRGNDLVVGGGGNDYLSGNQGRDTLMGGEGADVFVLDGDFDQDIIRDFRPAEGDRLEFVTYATHQIGWTGLNILSFATQQADGVLISLPDSDERVALLGVQLADLTADMFDVTSLVPTDELITMAELKAASLFDRIVITAEKPTPRVITAVETANISGSIGDDKIQGSAGDDIVAGGAGKDTINGGEGNDYIAGGAGNDKIFGQYGNNTLIGDEGDDTIDTGRDSSYIDAGNGNDVIVVQMANGADHLLSGGSGADSFKFFGFAKTTENNLIITDFELAVDKLIFQGIDAEHYFAKNGPIDITDTKAGALLNFGVNDTLLFTGLTAAAFLGVYDPPLLV